MGGRRGGRGSDQEERLRHAAIHGHGWRLVSDSEAITDIITQLRELAGGDDHLLAQVGGTADGAWLARPSPETTELLVATLLIRAGHGLRFDDLVPWVEEGHRRGLLPTHNASF
jgi:hypothetical protein